MNLFKPTSISRLRIGCLFFLSLLALASQCSSSPTLALPEPPAGPGVRIALLSPTAGDLATFGRRMRNGSLMVFDEWNERGGLLGHRLEWTVYNTDCHFETARRATQQALADGHQFIIGPLCSEAAIAAAELAETNQALLMSPTATHPLVTTNGQGQTRPTVFRAAVDYAGQGQAAARFALETLRVQKAALVYDAGDDYAAALSEAFVQQFSAQGGQLVYRTNRASGEIDFKSTLTAIKESGPELIYLPVPVPIANRLAGRLEEAGLSGSAQSAAAPILLGSDLWDGAELDLAVTAGSYYTTHFILDDQRPAVQSWREAYKATYAIEPDTLAVLGYDAALMLTQAIDRTGTFEPLAVARSLEGESYSGVVTGPIRFDRQHNPLKPVPVIRIDENGQKLFFGLIEPASSAPNF